MAAVDAATVHDYVERNRDRFVELLQRVVRQPSVSSQDRGVRECAALLVAEMSAIGIDARTLETGGQPVVYGELRSPRPDTPTLLLYTHYDVQPEDPVEAWSSPPFAADLSGGRIVGRGASDAKGNLICFLAAAEAFLRAGGGVPVNLKMLFDGEEESGSPSLPAFVDAHGDLLRCDCTLTFDGGFEPSDRPKIQCGSSGLLYVHLDCECATKDLHSARARLVANPAWRLVWALASMKGPDERILIDGFYDDCDPPDAAEQAVLDAYDWDDAAQKRHLGVDRFLTGVEGTAALERLLFQPTCNIAGFRHGYTGDGAKTVLPHRARAYVDFRLVWRQDPRDILRKLRRHLDARGFGDVRVTAVTDVEPSRSPLDSPVVRATVDAARETYPPAGGLVKPRGEASGRTGCWLGMRLGVAGATTGVGPPDWHGHAPDEFMTVSHFINGIHFAVNIWRRLAAEA